jgi:hypothetical protein
VRPYPEEIVQALQRAAGAHFAPELTSMYAQSQFGVGSMLFGIAVRDSNTAAQDLVDANRDLRALLADFDTALAASEHPGAVKGRHAIAVLPPPATDIRLSSLRAEFDALRQAFSDLAPLIEPAAEDPTLAPLESLRERTYAWFSADARRRSFPLLNN